MNGILPKSFLRLFCDKTFPREGKHMSPQSPGQMTTLITPKSNLMNSWVLLGFLRRIWRKGYLQEQKWLKTAGCITTAQPSMEDSSQKLGIRSTPQPAGSLTDWGALSKWVSWSKLFSRQLLLLPEHCSGNIFTSWLFYAARFFESASLHSVLFTLCVGRERGANSVRLRDYWRHFDLFAFCLKELPWRMKCFYLWGIYYITFHPFLLHFTFFFLTPSFAMILDY